jgi:hypothetical protein
VEVPAEPVEAPGLLVDQAFSVVDEEARLPGGAVELGDGKVWVAERRSRLAAVELLSPAHQGEVICGRRRGRCPRCQLPAELVDGDDGVGALQATPAGPARPGAGRKHDGHKRH